VSRDMSRTAPPGHDFLWLASETAKRTVALGLDPASQRILIGFVLAAFGDRASASASTFALNFFSGLALRLIFNRIELVADSPGPSVPILTGFGLFPTFRGTVARIDTTPADVVPEFATVALTVSTLPRLTFTGALSFRSSDADPGLVADVARAESGTDFKLPEVE
jgi:hypothetical protein